MKDTCPAKSGLCPSKNRFDWTTLPAPAAKLFEVLPVRPSKISGY